MKHVPFQVSLGYFTSFAESDDFEDVFRTGPQVALMIGAVNHFFQVDASPDEQCPDSLRRMEFVTGYREKIHAQFIHARRNLTE